MIHNLSLSPGTPLESPGYVTRGSEHVEYSSEGLCRR
jgi:hypothetical protein